MKKVIKSLIITLIYALLAFYFALPAINFKSKNFYMYVISVIVVYLIVSFLTKAKLSSMLGGMQGGKITASNLRGMKKSTKVLVGIIVVAAVVMIGGDLFSREFFHAKKYQQLMNVETREFSEDISQISLKDVPVVDRDSAVRLGNRKLGELVELVSQFEVDENPYSYTQINYNGVPTRVAPLRYGDIIKWFNNQSKGLPGYLSVDMTTQTVSLVQLEEGMKYSPGEYFFRNLDRHLRLRYPTKIFDDYRFEIDDSGKPYWICPVIDYTIGLFGGKDIKGVVLVDACNGDTEYYDIANAPSWIDQAYSSDLVVQQIDYWGMLKNGFINTIFGQKDVCKTSGGYNYLALDDDVWLYTGLTSAGNDASNIGFVLVNMRTKESHYYIVSGATEYSAMSSAEGQVQHLSYVATFPILLNIGNQPTYFISLKDNAGLVKMFAFVNVERYQIVAIGNTLNEAYSEYLKALAQNTEVDSSALVNKEGVVLAVSSAVRDGNTYYYIEIQGSDKVFVASIQMSDVLAVLKPGDTVKLGYVDSDNEFIDISEITRTAKALTDGGTAGTKAQSQDQAQTTESTEDTPEETDESHTPDQTQGAETDETGTETFETDTL